MKKSTDVLDMAPPRDLEAERCVLGSIILAPHVALDVAASIVCRADFYDDANREIFEVMSSLQANGKPIDTLTISAELKSRKLWDFIGGAAYIAKIAKMVPHAHHCRSYAEIVKKMAVRRSVIALGSEILAMAYDDQRDADSLTSAVNTLTTKAMEGTQRSQSKQIADCAEQIGDRIVKGEYAKQRGLQTRFHEFNRVTRGLCTGLVVLGARPSTGKSALMLNWAIDEAEQSGRAVGLFSLEMLAEEITERAISYRSGVEAERWGSLTGDERRDIATGVSRLIKTNVLIEDRADIGVGEICALVRLWSRQNDLAFVAIDYLQLIRPDNPKDSRQQQIGAMSRQLKRLSLELGIPVVVASQLNRDADGQRPSLRHLREAGDIEQDADVVHFLWEESQQAEATSDRKSRFRGRPEPQQEPEPACDEGPKRIKLTVAKNRNGRRNVDLDLLFFGSEFRFEEPAPAWMEDRERESQHVFDTFNNRTEGDF